MVQEVQRNCKECKEMRMTQRFAYPANDPRPEQLISDITPFEVIGIDHFGPLRTKNGGKGYGLLAVCVATRVLRLEWVDSLDAPETIKALVRLKARHPNLQKVISDNYPSFETLQNVNQDRWEMIAPRAPFQGGLWERAIKTVKRMLSPYLHGIHRVSTWRTLFAVAESVTNAKPLLNLIMDPDQVMITPADLAEAYQLTQLDWGKRGRWEKRWQHLMGV